MDTVNIIYVKALRKNGQKDRPDPRIREAVENINKTYKRVGVPYKLNLYDIESFLNKLNKKELAEITGTNGRKSDLIEKIQEEIPFEEARRREGVILKDGEWYHNDKKLEPLKLENITIDYETFRFIKKFDFHQDPKKYDTHSWKIYCVFNKKDENNIIHQVKYSKKQFTEKYVPNLKSRAKELFGNEVKDFYNTRKLENMINNLLSKEYEKGKIESFNENYHPFQKPLLLNTDLCAIYINSIGKFSKRKFEFERFIKIIDSLKIKYPNSLIRTEQSPGYDSADYPYISKLTDFYNKGEKINSKLYVLIDKFLPHINLSLEGNLFYLMLRHSNDETIGCAGNLKTLREPSVRFLLEHELNHLLTNARDIGNSELTIHTMDDKRLMSAPAHYVDLRTGKIDFNLGKISDESVRKAYNNIIK